MQLKKGLIIRGGCQEKTEELGMQGMGGRGSGPPVTSTPYTIWHITPISYGRKNHTPRVILQLSENLTGLVGKTMNKQS